MEFFAKVLFFTAFVLFANGEVLTHGDGTVSGTAYRVICNDTHIKVEWTKSDLDKRNLAGDVNNRNYTIAWKGQSSANCKTDNSEMGSIISLEADYPNGCGLTEKYTNDIIYYNQTIVITYGKNVAGSGYTIQREEYDYYEVACIRNRTYEQYFDTYNVSRRLDGKDVKNSTADYKFVFTHTDTGGTPPTDNKYNLGDYIKFKVELDTAGTTTKAVVQKCWSTSDGKNSAYFLVDNKCISDSGSRKLSSSDKLTSWETEAFRYLGEANSEIYVECLVRVCLDTDGSGECTFCSSRKRRDVGGSEESNGEYALIKSPIFYIVDREQTSTPTSNESSSSALSGTNGTIIIVLLATLVLVIAVAIIKKIFFPTVVAVPTVNGIENKGLA